MTNSIEWWSSLSRMTLYGGMRRVCTSSRGSGFVVGTPSGREPVGFMGVPSLLDGGRWESSSYSTSVPRTRRGGQCPAASRAGHGSVSGGRASSSVAGSRRQPLEQADHARVLVAEARPALQQRQRPGAEPLERFDLGGHRGGQRLRGRQLRRRGLQRLDLIRQGAQRILQLVLRHALVLLRAEELLLDVAR